MIWQLQVEIETIGDDDVPEVSASQDDELTAVEYEIVDGPRAKSKLLWIPIEKQFYVKNTVTKRGTSYLCHTANCKLRVILNSDLCYKTNSAEHHHANCEPDYKKYKALNEMKIIVKEDTKSSLKQIFNDVMSR